MVFWSGEQIAQHFPVQNVVSDYSPDKIDCNSYPLTVGTQYFITGDGEKRRSPGLENFSRGPDGNYAGVLIPTGQFAFLITNETVRIPANVMGFISLKTKTAKFLGLVNISGFHVDPGYQGQLIFSVFNAGPNPIHVKPGDPIFLLWIADIGTVTTPRSPLSAYAKSQPAPAHGIQSDIVSRVSGPLLSLQDISTKVSDLKQQVEILRNTALIFVSLAALAVGTVGVTIAWLNLNKQPTPATGQTARGGEQVETIGSTPPPPLNPPAAEANPPAAQAKPTPNDQRLPDNPPH